MSELEILYRKISWRLLPPLLLAYIVAYLDRVNVGFAKLQMLGDLHFSETVYGLGAGIFFIGYFLFGVPSNLILNRVGARRWITTLMIAWGIASAAMILVRTPNEFYALRFFLGIAEAGFFPGVIFYLSQWYPPVRRAQVTALFMTGIAICGAVGSVLSGAIMQSFHGESGLAGWQWLFLIEAAPAVVMGLYILSRLSDRIDVAPWLDAREKALLHGDLAASTPAIAKTSVGIILREPRVWLASVIYFCALTGLYGISFWLPTMVAELGVRSPLHIGLLSAIPYGAAAVGMVLVGRHSDRTGEQRWHMALPAAIGAVGLTASALLAENTILSMAALTVATFGIFTAPPLFWALPRPWLQGAAAAAGIAFINSFGCLAGFASPYLVGWIKDLTGSTHTGLYIISAFVLTGAVLVIACTPRTSRTPLR